MKKKITLERVLITLVFLFLATAPLYLPMFRINLLGKYMCYAIVALGLDMIWGFTGILSLGHGVYFGLGAYCMAMYLKLEAAGGGLPDFMVWSGISKLPVLWHPFASPAHSGNRCGHYQAKGADGCLDRRAVFGICAGNRRFLLCDRKWPDHYEGQAN